MAPATPGASVASNGVAIAGFAFSPSTLTVSKGTTVTCEFPVDQAHRNAAE